MGNYSYIEEQEGCLVDIVKLKETFNSITCTCKGYRPTEKGYFRIKEDLGNYIDGWKIQGYWYQEFVNFLYACADAMELTEDKYINYISMEEEQGFKFTIYFYLEDDKPKVSISFVPMEWIDQDLERT